MTTSTTDAEFIARVIENAMQDAWNDICDDTGCHPLDLERRSGHLTFRPGHWSRAVGQHAATTILSYLASRREAQEPIQQYRVRHCADWYDGHPDPTDGKDYETRVVYTTPPSPAPAPAGEVERLREALEIIAGKRQCVDNLMSNADVARAALNGVRHD